MKTVTLHGEKAAGRVALVDDEDYELVTQYRWRVFESVRRGGRPHGPYAIANARIAGRRIPIYMHRLITGWPRTDHANHDGLDNQRVNLRPATGSQNNGNQRPTGRGASAFKGVGWNPDIKKWNARVKLGRRTRYLGSFASELDAAHAYDAAAREIFGEFACLNFPAAA